jgi:hypothetical protein
MSNSLTPNQQLLFAAELQASPHVGDDQVLPSVTVVINGHTITVSSHYVNRKCYDNLPTPTVMFKVSGKRVSRAAAYALAA